MKISLCLITKDEEKNIGKCIKSVKDIVHEIIVVDTGSTDRTIDIARELKATVYTFEWVNDFSKARNYALSKATGDWIIFLDADEYISADSAGQIPTCIMRAEEQKKEAILGELINLQDDSSIIDVVKSIRIFKRDKDIFYEGAIHEAIKRRKKSLSTLVCYDEVKIYHTGYSSEDMLAKNKKERNLAMLLEQEKKNKHSSELCYYIAQTYSLYGEYEKVLEYTKKVERYRNLSSNYIYIMSKRYQLNAAVAIGKDPQLIQDIYRGAVAKYPDYPDYDHIMARYELGHKHYDEVITCLNRCLTKLGKYNGVAEVYSGAKLEEIFETLSKLYIGMQNYEEAVPTLVKLLKYNKYNVYGIYQLIAILGTTETDEAIYQFMMRLYEPNVLKDMFLLIKICRKQNKYLLVEYIMQHLDQDILEKINQVVD